MTGTLGPEAGDSVVLVPKPEASGQDPLGFWLAAGCLIVLSAVLLKLAAPVFRYEAEVIDMPVIALSAALAAAGLVFCIAVPWLILRSARTDGAKASRALITVLVAGLAARLVLMTAEPILEVDFYRYLWDGAVTSHGLTPYAQTPKAVMAGKAPAEYVKLAEDTDTVLKRVNHKDVTSIYPPVTQAAFALAHVLKPWSLTAWRLVLLAFDLATAALLIAGLDRLGHSRLWVALYWWNPVVLKELFNSAHLEPLIFPFLLAALLYAHARKPIAASTALGFAAGVKFWPALLLPLILRASGGNARHLAAALAVFGALLCLWLWPMLMGGLGEKSGLVAYASGWKRNGPLFAMIDGSFQTANGIFGFDSAANVSLAARGFVAALAGVAAAGCAVKPVRDFADLAGRALVITAAIVLLSPSVYPWYTLWFLPLLVWRPVPGLILVSATIPLYYLFFHFAARESTQLFHDFVPWLIWLPPLVLLVWQAARSRGFGAGPHGLRRQPASEAVFDA